MLEDRAWRVVVHNPSFVKDHKPVSAQRLARMLGNEYHARSVTGAHLSGKAEDICA